ncbi:MAG: putative O-linked N-acetylglucosamine transferase, family [Ramlibacter sp.]|nr:putative O-linked N-acetylglucosamine transferase, family [Ramlibacter sp.]
MPAELAQAWASGFQLHQAGQLSQAADLYRKVLARAPEHFGARHLLGVIALQEGRLDEAREHIANAIRIDPKQGAAHSNLGTVLLRSGRLPEARAALEAALALNPKDPGSAATLGTTLLQMGEPAAAAARFRAALAAGASVELRNELAAALLETGDAAGAVSELQALLLQRPEHASAHSNLGVALERVRDFEGALRHYEQAVVHKPGYAQAWDNRASLLARMGRFDEARRGFEEAVRQNPGLASAHANLGALLGDIGQLALAGASLRKALELDPRLFEARLNSALFALESGDTAQAQLLLAALLKDHPRSAEAHVLQGRAWLAQKRLDEADAALQQALRIDPRLAPAHHVLGLVRMSRGDAKGARQAHEQASELDPANAVSRWGAVVARVPAVVEHAAQAALSRESFAQGVGELDRWFDASRAGGGHAAVGSVQPFYLAYQPGNHRELLQPYGRLCERLMSAWPGRPQPKARRPEVGGAIRIGVVSAQVRDHSVWTAILRGWVQQLDRSRFDVHVFSLGTASDAQTRAARELVPHFEAGPAGLQEWVARIGASELDVLIYPEIGMDAMTVKLASLRLAPLQLATWGHPLTTGLPTIDAFVSAAAFEPPDAQDHYSEHLVALPGLGVHYEPLQVVPAPIDRKALGLPPAAPLLVCPGLPYKYAGDDDHLWADIAQQLPEARLVFFKGGPELLHQGLRQRLKLCFEARGMVLDDHVSWLPLLNRPQFFGLMRDACLFLDTVGFSGFNTVMQAVECELPIVALEGDSLRGRFGSGVLREIGLDECVATTKPGYVELAVALAWDAGRRAAIKSHMRQHRGRLFGTPEPVRALERFLEQRLRTNSY